MKFFDYFNEKKWEEIQLTLPGIQNLYRRAKPFPHIVLDGLFDPITLMEAEDHFPKPDANWWKYDNFMERKWAKDDLSNEHPIIRGLIHNMQDKKFVKLMESITGIDGLITDHNLNGGGMHQMSKGGKLDLHIDYNYHPITYLDRRLNVLLYLNFGWKAKWKGDLELWDYDVENCCVRRIAPVFNRMVIFSTTEESVHGLPEPLECPENMTRKSLALYYYTNGRPEEETAKSHSTIYKKRPQDPDDEEEDRLRKLRAIKRLQ